jgi:ABC-type transport system involved in cytochrome bd biosynthesis fused ATPase/permease subunit
MKDFIENYDKLGIDDKVSKQEIFKLSLMIIFYTTMSSFLTNISLFQASSISIPIRAYLSQIVYRKALKLSKNALQKTSTGQIVNLLTTDLNRMEQVFNV